MLPWLVSLLIAGPAALIGGPAAHDVHHAHIDCYVQHSGDSDQPQRCSWRVVCTAASKHLVGHDVARARQIAHRYGCTVRVAIRDGKELFLRANLELNRIDVAVRDERVVRITEIG